MEWKDILTLATLASECGKIFIRERLEGTGGRETSEMKCIYADQETSLVYGKKIQ